MKATDVSFLDGAILVTSNDVESNHVLDDGELTIEERPSYDFDKAHDTLSHIAWLAQKVRRKLFAAEQMISPMDQWDAMSVLSTNELWELAERATYVDDMIDRRVEDLSKEVGI